MYKSIPTQGVCGTAVIYICLHLMVSAASGAQYSYSKLNTTCITDKDCRAGETYLTCRNYICTCRDHEAYDRELGVCRIKVPSQCFIKSGYKTVQPCIRDAYCAFPLDQNGNELRTSVHGSCTCFHERSPRVDGLCNSGALKAIAVNYKSSYLLLLFGYLIRVVVEAGWGFAS